MCESFLDHAGGHQSVKEHSEHETIEASEPLNPKLSAPVGMSTNDDSTVIDMTGWQALSNAFHACFTIGLR